MILTLFREQRAARILAQGLALCSLAASSIALHAQSRPHFKPYNLVVSRSVYDSNPANVKVGELLPPNCAGTQGKCAGGSGATNDGTFPYVFNNALYDGSFGITRGCFSTRSRPSAS